MLKEATLSNENIVPGSVQRKDRPKSMELVEEEGIISMFYLVKVHTHKVGDFGCVTSSAWGRCTTSLSDHPHSG